MERMEAIVSGRVQGVMYRDFVQRKGSGLTLTGEVQNLKDRTVKVVAEGERASLEKLVVKLHRGSVFSRVDHVSVSWMPATSAFKKFSIRY